MGDFKGMSTYVRVATEDEVTGIQLTKTKETPEKVSTKEEVDKADSKKKVG